MKLSDIATQQDLAFWAYAEKHGVRSKLHSAAITAGKAKADGMPAHRKPNAFKAAYNAILRDELDLIGWSWAEHLLAKKENRQQVKKPKQPPKINRTPARKVDDSVSSYDTVDMSQLIK